MKETITYEDILRRLQDRINSIRLAMKDRNNALLRDICACSIICDDENIVPCENYPRVNDNYEFIYKGYSFELSNCIAAGNSELDKKHILTDRYVCWMSGKKNDMGQTLDEYLEDNPNESVEDNCWCPKMYLVPDAWAWGSEFDLIPGNAVEKLILEHIDKFLEQNPEL